MGENVNQLPFHDPVLLIFYPKILPAPRGSSQGPTVQLLNLAFKKRGHFGGFELKEKRPDLAERVRRAPRERDHPRRSHQGSGGRHGAGDQEGVHRATCIGEKQCWIVKCVCCARASC